MYGIDLFCGAGGLSLGAKLAGVNVAFAVDRDENACRSYRKNNESTVCLNFDLSKDVPKFRKISPKNLIVFGGPPCQGFSTSNQKTRTLDNPGNWLFKSYFRCLSKLEPKFFVLENVGGILQTEKGLFVREIQSTAKRHGYLTTLLELDAQHFGIPQRRRRIFIVGHKYPLKLRLEDYQVKKETTVRDAIGDLPNLECGNEESVIPYKSKALSRYAARLRGGRRTCDGHLVSENAGYVVERYKHIPPGGNWRSIPAQLMDNYTDRMRCHTGIYRRLEWDRPSVVIGNFRKNMLIHPEDHRGLSVREAARLQSFPDSYSFEGSIGKQQQQVGNAVPPELARLVFSEILRRG